MKQSARLIGTMFAILIGVLGLGYAIVRVVAVYDAGTLQNQRVDVVSSDAFELLLKREDIILIDFRTQEEFDAGHIEGAVYIDPNVEQTLSQQFSIMDPRKTYLVYCYGGRRSREMAERMKTLGYAKIVQLDGGFKQWLEDEKPYVTGK